MASKIEIDETFSKKVDYELLDYHLNDLDQLWIQPNYKEASAFLCYWKDRTKKLFKRDRLCKSINKYINGIINLIESKVTNDLFEGMNSKFNLSKELLEAIDIRIILNV